jgi:hypothetical protein
VNAQKYLQQIRVLDTKIRQKEEQIESLKLSADGAGAIRYDKDIVQVSKVDSKMESIVVQYVAIEEEVKKQKLHLEQMKQIIIDQIQELTDDRYINVLFKRYVQIKSYELIAVEMNYSFDYVKELHRDALEEFRLQHPTLSHL